MSESLPWVPHHTIQKLCDAAMAIPASREALLTALPASFTQQLSLRSTPKEQLIGDLDTMNNIRHLEDGSVPLQTWLENAVYLAGPRREKATFLDALEDIQRQISQGVLPAPTRRAEMTSAHPVGRGGKALGITVLLGVVTFVVVALERTAGVLSPMVSSLTHAGTGGTTPNEQPIPAAPPPTGSAQASSAPSPAQATASSPALRPEPGKTAIFRAGGGLPIGGGASRSTNVPPPGADDVPIDGKSTDGKDHHP